MNTGKKYVGWLVSLISVFVCSIGANADTLYPWQWNSEYSGANSNTIALYNFSSGAPLQNAANPGTLDISNVVAPATTGGGGRFGDGLLITPLSIANDGYATLDADLFPSGTDPSLTIEVWVKFNSYTNFAQVIVDKFYIATSNRRGYALFKWGTDLFFDLADGTDLMRASALNVFPDVIETNVWHHIAGTWDADSDTQRIYIDGALRAEVMYSGMSITNYPGQGRIGERLAANYYGVDASFDGFRLSDTAYDFAEPFPTPLAYLPFDSSAEDVVGNHDGSLSNDAHIVTSGQILGDGAVSLDGSGDRVVLDYADLNITGDMSISIWVKPNDIVTRVQQIFSRGEWNKGHALQQNYTNLVTRFGDSLSSSSAFAVGTWTYVAYTYDSFSSLYSLYVNGVKVGTYSSGIASDVPDTPTFIGAEGYGYPTDIDGRFPFNGMIDDVAIWNKAITETQIKAIYNLANDSSLRYGLGDSMRILQAFDSDSGEVIINNKRWERVSGLTGTPGDLLESDKLILTADGYGMRNFDIGTVIICQ